MNTAKTAELFAAVNVAMADAGIDAWYYKYVYDLWRPVVGIRNEHSPHGDPFWKPLGAPRTNSAFGTLTPPFPAYPSGHATFGAALMQSLRLLLNPALGPITLQEVLDVEDQILATGAATVIAQEKFTFVSDELDGISRDPDGSVRTRVPKEFANFAEPVWENSVSRIYLGVHWRFDGIAKDAISMGNTGSATNKIGGVPLGLAVGIESTNFFIQGDSL